MPVDSLGPQIRTQRTAPQILAEARKPAPAARWPMVVTGVTLLAAAGLAMFSLESDTVRARGSMTMASVQLRAATEGAAPVALQDGAKIPSNAVIFRAEAAGPGFLLFLENGEPMVPARHVEAGTHYLQGSSPAAWRPDQPLEGSTQYSVLLCPDAEPGPACQRSEVELTW